MEQERLKVFDEEMNLIGFKSREEVHQYGYWHETFHCWFTIIEEDIPYIFFQRRSKYKKDFPNLLDITCAGHLLADESVEDGVREIEEELGLVVDFSDLLKLGVVKEEILRQDIKDREFCHVFLYPCESLPYFKLQAEEVSGIYKIRLIDFKKLINGEIHEITGHKLNHDQSFQEEILHLNDFLFHNFAYYNKVIQWIHNICRQVINK